MNVKRYLQPARQAVLIAVVAGTVGGVVGARMSHAPAVDAQDGALNVQSVTTREFRFVDDQGKLRGQMAFSPETGEVYFNLRDQDEWPLLVFSVTGNGAAPSIEVREKGTMRRAQIAVANGAPTYYLFDRAGNERSHLGMADVLDVPFFRMRDANSQERLYFGQYGDTTPHIDIRNAGGEAQWAAP